jgi:hypothetical protein
VKNLIYRNPINKGRDRRKREGRGRKGKKGEREEQ